MPNRSSHSTLLLALLGAVLVAAPTGAAPAKKQVATRSAKPTRHAAPVARPGGTPKNVPVTNPGVPDTAAAPGAIAAADSSYAIPAGQEGAVFKSLTVEGEDRVHFEFERPELTVDLDPHQAPGLDPGSAADVLQRSGPELLAPFSAISANSLEPCLARPWLSQFTHGAVARFRPDVSDVARWRLLVANAKGETVATMEGKGQPPKEIAWDGRAQNGAMVTPELTYSYVFEAHDRAGNKRNFLGEGFQVSAYRTEDASGPRLAFGAKQLAWSDGAPARASTVPPILLESASWLNQAERPGRPVEVTVVARGYEQAQALVTRILPQLAANLVGDPARVRGRAVVQPDAPEAGTVEIGFAQNSAGGR